MEYRDIAEWVYDRLRVPHEWRSGYGLQCKHERCEPRLRVLSNGAKTVYRQCLSCGSSVGGAQPSKGAIVLPGWDVALERRFQEAREQFYELYRQRIKDVQDQQDSEWWEKYRQYINPLNPRWQDKRRRVLERCGGICEACLRRQATEVHHTSYDHFGDEPLFELRGVCRSCHDKLHPHRTESGPTVNQPIGVPRKG